MQLTTILVTGSIVSIIEGCTLFTVSSVSLATFFFFLLLLFLDLTKTKQNHIKSFS